MVNEENEEIKICKLCGTDKNIRKHHINYEKNEFVYLCQKCHSDVHHHKHELESEDTRYASNGKTIQCSFRCPKKILLQLKDKNKDMVDFAPGKLCQEIIFQYVKKMNEIPEEHHNFFIENPKILLYAGEILMIMGITIFLIISW